MTELSKKIGLCLSEFYKTMQDIEKISDYREREGKKATKLIMTINDIERIINEIPKIPEAKG